MVSVSRDHGSTCTIPERGHYKCLNVCCDERLSSFFSVDFALTIMNIGCDNWLFYPLLLLLLLLLLLFKFNVYKSQLNFIWSHSAEHLCSLLYVKPLTVSRKAPVGRAGSLLVPVLTLLGGSGFCQMGVIHNNSDISVSAISFLLLFSHFSQTQTLTSQGSLMHNTVSFIPLCFM